MPATLHGLPASWPADQGDLCRAKPVKTRSFVCVRLFHHAGLDGQRPEGALRLGPLPSSASGGGEPGNAHDSAQCRAIATGASNPTDFENKFGGATLGSDRSRTCLRQPRTSAAQDPLCQLFRRSLAAPIRSRETTAQLSQVKRNPGSAAPAKAPPGAPQEGSFALRISWNRAQPSLLPRLRQRRRFAVRHA